LIRVRFPAALFVAFVLASFARPFPVLAAPEVHKLNLVISGIPGSVKGGGFNDVIDAYNQLLESHGIIGLDHIASGWHFDGELRYFVRPNLAIALGVGSITVSQSGEVFPRLQQDITYEAKMSGVPVHLGAGYYLAPYRQGDFQARAYFGAGLVSMFGVSATLTENEVGTDSSTTLGNPRTPPNSFTITGTNDSPGFYAEGGAHMWFASRFSVMLGAYYRSARVDNLVLKENVAKGVDRGGLYDGVIYVNGKPASADFSGLGFRMAIGIGL